jgi:NAD(P)-dependent dehydrogenase (short-subunit alcohol dehydrogenase family)
LVTGCSKGVGFATALALAGDGWDVIATLRTPDATPKRRGLAPTGSKPAGDRWARRHRRAFALRRVQRDWSAGRPREQRRRHQLLLRRGDTDRRLAPDVDSNFLGTVRCMRAALPAVRQRRSGCIVNVTTVAVPAAFAGTAAYAASKGAVEHLSAVAAIEGRPHGVRVVVVEGGAIATGMRPDVRAAGGKSWVWRATWPASSRR